MPTSRHVIAALLAAPLLLFRATAETPLVSAPVPQTIQDLCEPEIGLPSQSCRVDSAEASSELRQYSETDLSLRRHLRLVSSDGDAWYSLGYTAFHENQPRESLDAYTHAASIRSPRSEDLRTVALDYVLLDDYPDAERWLKVGLEMDSRNKDAWYDLGRVYFQQSRFAEAREAFLKVLQIDTHHVKAETYVGLIAEYQGDRLTASRDFTTAMQWQANTVKQEAPMLYEGMLLLEENRAEDASPVLLEAVMASPRDTLARGELGLALLRLHNFNEARIQLEIARELAPDNPRWHYELGRTYQKLNMQNAAQEEMANCARLFAAANSEMQATR